jgi:hypothetical protein
LKPLAIPLWQSDAVASATALEDGAPDPGAGPANLVRTHVIATLTESEALALQGRHARFRVEGLRDGWDLDDWTIFSCAGLRPLRRTVWLRAGQDVDDPMTVEAVLRVVPHAPRNDSPGFTELRLCRARVVH